MSWTDTGGLAAFLRSLVRDQNGRLYRREILREAPGASFGVSDAAVIAAFRRVAVGAVAGGPATQRYYEGWSWK